jgi:hypothetical protein
MTHTTQKLVAFALLIAATAMPNFVFAQSEAIKPDANYILPATAAKPDAAAQKKHYTSNAWRNFAARNGKWVAEFDALTGMPTRAFVAGFDGSTATDAVFEAAARQFLAENLATYGINPTDLVYTGTLTGKKYHYINFKQQYNGVDVLQSEYTLRLTPDGKVPMFGLRYFAISNRNLAPQLSATALAGAAQTGITGTINSVTQGDLKILPMAADGKYEMHLVAEMRVKGIGTDRIPFDYNSWIDADNGAILMRQNKVCTMHIEPTDDPQPEAHINAISKINGSLRSNFLQTAQLRDLPYLQFNVNGTQVVGDVNGNYNFNITQPATAQIRLLGKYATVYKTTTTSPTLATVTIPSDGSPIDLTAQFSEQELAGYYFTSLMKDHFLATTNNDPILGNSQMQVIVERTDGTCNAFYDGGLNFYAAGGGCPSTSLFDDVVYHEYGHHINGTFAGPVTGSTRIGIQNGAIQEGYADVWAMTFTDNPLLGAGFSTTPTSFVRRYDAAPKVYPVNIVGEVHGDGEIIAGAWWDTRVNLNDTQIFKDLFVESNHGYSNASTDLGVIFHDILIETLLADDTDANITNGSAHSVAIRQAFARHGITLVTGLFFEHTPPTTLTPNQGTVIDASLYIDSDYLPYLGAVKMVYHTNTDNNWTTVNMADPSNTQTYSSTLPAQPGGSMIWYYLTVEDNAGTPAGAIPEVVMPTDALHSNLPYLLMYGYTQRAIEDFDARHLATGAAPFGWSVATQSFDVTPTGAWVLVDPNGSLTGSGVAVQTADDHTTGATNTKCFVTGNATSNGIGDADVDQCVTTLTSPIFDAVAYNEPAISYWRWFSNDKGANPKNDPWRTFVSNDGGTTWTDLEFTYEPHNDINTSTALWRQYAFRVADFVSPTTQMRLKFQASDSLIVGNATFNGGSVMEAAIDDIQVWERTFVNTNQVAANVALTVFPNPTSNAFTVQLGSLGKGQTTLTLYNAIGQQVFTKTITDVLDYQIDTKNLAAGTYLLTAQGANFVGQQRVNVIK